MFLTQPAFGEVRGSSARRSGASLNTLLARQGESQKNLADIAESRPLFERLLGRSLRGVGR